MRFVDYIIGTTLLVTCFMAHAEIVSWVDEKGRKHYGDSVPPKYKEQSEMIEQKPLNIIAPESSVRADNSASVKKYRRQDAAADLNHQKNKTNKNVNKKRSSNTLSRSECRDTYTKVKKRTECFKRAAKANLNN